MKEQPQSFLSQIRLHIDNVKNISDLSEETIKTYESTYSFFKSYVTSDIQISSLSEDYFYRLITWAKNKDYAPEYIKRKINHIVPVIKKAIRNGFLRYDVTEEPIKLLKPKKVQDQIRSLSQEDIDKIKAHDFGELYKTRKELLLFQIDTGLSFSDMVNCKNHELKNIDGVEYICGYRNKTKNGFMVILHPEFRSTYMRIKQKRIDLSYFNYRNFLKSKVNDLLGFQISSHISRYTFIRNMQNKGYSNEVIAVCAGHSTTQMIERVYGKMTVERLARETKKLNIKY